MIKDYILPAIKGLSPFDIELIHARMDRVVKGHNYAKAAVDIACYDLMGKATNLPAYVFLGARSGLRSAWRTALAKTSVRTKSKVRLKPSSLRASRP